MELIIVAIALFLFVLALQVGVAWLFVVCVNAVVGLALPVWPAVGLIMCTMFLIRGALTVTVNER